MNHFLVASLRYAIFHIKVLIMEFPFKSQIWNFVLKIIVSYSIKPNLDLSLYYICSVKIKNSTRYTANKVVIKIFYYIKLKTFWKTVYTKWRFIFKTYLCFFCFFLKTCLCKTVDCSLTEANIYFQHLNIIFLMSATRFSTDERAKELLLSVEKRRA